MALTKISTGGFKDDAASQAKIADEAVDEARLQVSNAGTNGQFLQKSSGTGGLTWATATTDTSDKASLSGATFTGNVGIGGSPSTKLDVTGGEVYYHSGTGNNLGVKLTYSNANSTGILDTYSNHPLEIRVNNSEKFRLGTAGQLGIGGATYGSSGQVLTSGGSGAAPSWAAVPAGGNSIDLVADGAIAAGKAVIIKSNGKAEQVQQVTTATDGLSSTNAQSISPSGAAMGSAPTIGRMAVAYDPDSDRICYIYRDSSNNLKASLWSTNGNAFTQQGSTITAGNAANNNFGICHLSSRRFAVVYYRGTSPSRTMIRILSVNTAGDTLTGNSEFNLDGNNSDNAQYKNPIPMETTTNRIVVLSKSDNSDCAFAANTLGIIVTDVNSSNQHLTFRKAERLGADNPDGYWDMDYDSTNGVFAAIWDTSGNNQRMMAFKVAAGDAAAVTEGSTITVQSGDAIGRDALKYHANSGAWISAYKNAGSGASGALSTIAHTINSSTLAITSGSVQTYSNQGPPDSGLSICISAEHHIYYVWIQQNKKVYGLSGTVSGTTITLNTSNVSEQLSNYTTDVHRLGAVYMGHNSRIAYWGTADGEENDTSFYGSAETTSQTSNLTTNNQNFLGFAEDAISDGATGTIKLEGNVVGNQSGLTPGTFYAVNGAGVLGSGGSAYSCGGLAVASDKLRIKDVQKS